MNGMNSLPKFKEEKEDNPAQHLLEFHECMDQLGIVNEDVLMKLFMFSGRRCSWSISSLKDVFSG
jgi:hypothetical protein